MQVRILPGVVSTSVWLKATYAYLSALDSAAGNPKTCGSLPQKGAAMSAIHTRTSSKTLESAKERRAPGYRRHRQSGHAIVTLSDGLGRRRDVLLGKYGTAASRQEYARVIAEWESSGRQLSIKEKLPDLTVAELITRFWPWVQNYYRRPDGTETSEVGGFMYSLRPLNHLYGSTPAVGFGPAGLKAVRELMIHGYQHARYGPQGGLARSEINHRIKRIRRMFK